MVQEALNERQLAKLKTQYHTKVMLTLEDSGKENWGVVRDMSGKLFDPIDTAQIIGTWSRAPYDNLIHVSLTTPLQALSDRAVLIWTEISERRTLSADQRIPQRQGHISDDATSSPQRTSPSVVYLSYLQITDSLTSLTPNLVIHEIAEAHGIICDASRLTDGLYRLAIIHEIHSRTPPTIDLQNMTSEDYRYLARFVNPTCRWTVTTLQQALNTIKNYFSSKHFNSMVSDFITGRPTPKNPNSLSIIILYGVCLHYHLTIDPKDNLKSLAKKLRIYLDYQIDELRTNISTQLGKISYKSHLVNLLSLLNSYLPVDTYYHGNCSSEQQTKSAAMYYPISSIDFDEVDRAGKSIFADRFKKRFVPRNRAEAIAYVALTYQIDLIRVKNTDEELRALQMKKYHPIDSRLVERFNSQYSRLDSPNLKLVFNPELPRSCYLPKYLRELARYEGFIPVDSDEYGFLQQAYLSETFHHGKLPNIKDQETKLEWELVSSLSFHQLVCYGVRNQTSHIVSASTEWHAYTYNELLFCFTQASVYLNPANIHNEPYSPLAVRKLLSLAEQPQYEDESKEDYQIRQALAKRIHYIELVTNQLSPEAQKLLYIYQDKDKSSVHEIHARKIKDLLYQLRDLGFYMRGWMGKEKLPVTRTNIKDMTKVEIRVVDVLAEFEHNCLQAGNVGQLILTLPLLEYKGKVFIPPQKKEDGLTIKDRLHIIKHGDSHYNENASCIRVTSNRIVATAYRYLTILDLKPGFKIEDLTIIF